MAADCCIRLEMYSEAGQLFERVPADSRTERFLICKAGMLYLINDFIGLRELLSGSSLTTGNPAALNLLGNAEFALGRWDDAFDAYVKAWDAIGSQPVYALNAARACDKAGNSETAIEYYGKASKLYFRNGEYDELLGILPFIQQLDNNSLEAEAIKSKVLFYEERFDEADKIFTRLVKNNIGDSTIYYLKALIESRAGKKRKASGLFKKAIELEPDYYLYYFKKAEFLFLTGGKYRKDLDTALELAPDEPWVLNLSGQALLSEGDSQAAAAAFADAVKLAPDESGILINYSEALYLSGRSEEAISILTEELPEILNQRGNIYSRMED
jgi:tetratricopeptide (TPR) repeat protein